MGRNQVRVWRICGKVLWKLTQNVVNHDIASLAATISFYVFFSLFPLLILIIYALSVLVPGTQTELVLQHLVSPYFPALPDARDFITENITRLAVIGGKVGWLSALTLTWSATSGFIAIQQAMDVIFETPQRHFVTRRIIAFGMLIILLILTLVSALVTAFYPEVKTSLLFHLAFFAHWAILAHGLSRVIFPASIFIGLLVLYRYFPSQTKGVPWTFLFPGALVATLTLDLGREMFVWYAGHLVRYQLIYGGLAAVMLLFLWIYIGGIFILFGAEVSATLQSVWRSEQQVDSE